MRFRCYDNLRLFEVVAGHGSFTAAARSLNLTKGAVSYQISRLEDELGFKVFDRVHRRTRLTAKGKALWQASQLAFAHLERDIERLREDGRDHIVIGLSTYFASRWLSGRLMTFLTQFPDTGLRLQPVVDLFDFQGAGIDMAIRWGDGKWSDVRIEPLFHCPSFPTAGKTIAKQIKEAGLEATLPDLTLLKDCDDSVAWRDWHKAAHLNYSAGQDNLVIPDPNVRVQAVIDGQGVALNDELVANELTSGDLVTISDVALADYGYFLAYPDEALDNPRLREFRDWLLFQAKTMDSA